jgi:tetratricopeptide (TPR) repeat protein
MAESLWGIAAQKAQQAFFSYFSPGRIKKYTEIAIETLKIAEDSGDSLSRGISYAAYGWACFLNGDIKGAEKYALRGRDLCVRIGFIGWAAVAHECLASVYFYLKDYRESRNCWSRIMQSQQETRINPSNVLRMNLALAREDVMLGEKNVDLDKLRQIAEHEKIKMYKGWSCGKMAEILLNLGGNYYSEAEKWIQKAIDANARNGMNFKLGMDYAVYGDLFRRMGDRDKAQNTFHKSVKVLQECGADWWAEQYQKELVEL